MQIFLRFFLLFVIFSYFFHSKIYLWRADAAGRAAGVYTPHGWAGIARYWAGSWAGSGMVWARMCVWYWVVEMG